jgi:ATP-dependent Zn protease
MNGNKMSELTKARVDKEVERVINYALKETIKIIDKNIKPLAEISDLLIKENSISSNVLDNIDISY